METETMTSPPVKPPSLSPPPPSVSGLARVDPPRYGKKKAVFLPPRIIINAIEGWGKSTTAAHMPKAGILQARGETGYETLLGQSLVPSIDCATVENWEELFALLDDFIAQENFANKSLAFDALNGYERLCHEFVCARDFNGDWGEKGFTSYQKGYDVAVTDWLIFLNKLDKIRAKGVMILILSHSKITTFKNPMGPDYDQYAADVHNKTWAATAKWADAVLFGKFKTILDRDQKTKVQKGVGGTQRILYTQNADAYNAKNRYAMPWEIDIPDDPSQSWATIWKHIHKHSESESEATKNV